MVRVWGWLFGLLVISSAFFCGGRPWYQPYDERCTQRKEVFEFTEEPRVKVVGEDRYEITFAVKDYCDVTVSVVDEKGRVIRHLASGVLGKNAPKPFQKGTLKQRVVWDGKDDLERYVEHPERMKIRVSLGLKLEHYRRLGGTSPYDLPGYVWGLAADKDGVYVFYKGPGAHGHVGCRKFDHDGRYVGTLVPPRADMPESKLVGYSYVEYEPGKKALHGVDRHQTVARDGHFLMGGGGRIPFACQPAVVGNRLYFTNGGLGGASFIYYIHNDGSTDMGVRGKPFAPGEHLWPRLCASPDGKRIYAVGVKVGWYSSAVWVWDVAGRGKAKVFAGDPRKPGSNEKLLGNNVGGIDCDGKGRVYVCDLSNNRIQVFGPGGKLLKTIRIISPHRLRVDQRRGAIYVVHQIRVRGRMVWRLTKLRSFERPVEEYHVDGFPAELMALDVWAPKVRIWTAGERAWANNAVVGGVSGPGVRVWEDTGKGVRLLLDFDKEARRAAGRNYVKWSGVGSTGPRVYCDPVREEAYFGVSGHYRLFDLKTGDLVGHTRLDKVYRADDIAFDKKGYLHAHLNPGVETAGVVRFDPSRRKRVKVHKRGKAQEVLWYPEVPYDYGVEVDSRQKGNPWMGLIPTKDQPGTKYFQDGLGVNMRGDVAEECNIWYVPKMGEKDYADALGMSLKEIASEKGGTATYSAFMRWVKTMEKKGERVYFLRRRPGLWLRHATVWVFEADGEPRYDKPALWLGRWIAGVGIDEDGYLYVVHNRVKAVNGKRFLVGRGGIFGGKSGMNPFTGTCIKFKPPAYVISQAAPLKMDDWPKRPPDLFEPAFPELPGSPCWAVNAEWMYAGASPIVCHSCSCPTSRFHLDWYKRSWVPEAYRHSVGVVDAAGNLILHVGTYGNYDSIDGPRSKVRVKGDIAMCVPRFLSGTDNYFAYDFWGEALVVLKIGYHQEREVSLKDIVAGRKVR